MDGYWIDGWTNRWDMGLRVDRIGQGSTIDAKSQVEQIKCFICQQNANQPTIIVNTNGSWKHPKGR
jgi:hypothetical protein